MVIFTTKTKISAHLRMLAKSMLSILFSVFLFAGSASADFGVQSFGASLINQDGTPALQAGAHPYSLNVSFKVNSHIEHGESGEQIFPDGDLKDGEVNLPPGLIVDPTATETRCTEAEIERETECPWASAVGIAGIELDEFGRPNTVYAPIYNMVPPPGIPAQFAFNVYGIGIIVHLDGRVRTGGDYGLSSDFSDASSKFSVLGVAVTLWGNPSDPSHDNLRGGCAYYGGGACGLANRVNRPLLTQASFCEAPQTASLRLDSWQEPGVFTPVSTVSLPAPTGCQWLGFDPQVSVQPDTSVASAPTGLDVDLRVPQNDGVNGLAEANLREAVIRFPAGLAVSPSAAEGLGACSPEGIGLDNDNAALCPDSSKLGSVQVTTPLLGAPLEGSLYLAQQGNAGAGQGSNPFGSLAALYLVAEGSGVLLKLPGELQLDPVTGQVTVRFGKDPVTGQLLPQLPFSDLTIHMFGGPRAALVTPSTCGTYTTSTQLTPYSSLTPAEPSDSFAVSSGCGGGFAPSFMAGTTDNQAGGFSPLSVTFSRTDQDQNLGSIQIQTPPGLLGLLKSVPLCPEPQAAQGTCGAESLIGHTTVGAGPGPDPFYLGGQVFLTGPYKGAPFGLSIVVPAVAGPFNLGTVVVRASISVDPHTAALTIASDPLPTILDGIPLQIRTVNVTVDRPGFVFNPTNCDPLTVSGTLTSAEGASSSVSSRFQAANCGVLAFAPKLLASSPAKTSLANGAALDVKVAYPSGAQANIHSVAVTLPKQLPARLSTIQQACPEGVFNPNPASCDAGSMIGTGTASTPIFNNPLTGPAYLVSHGGAAFPDIDVVLQGEGVTILLVGHISISKAGVTSATFFAVPDAPISGFDLSLPEGPHSGLSAVGSLCATPLNMPTTITGQNGAVVKQTTKIDVTGCPKAKKKKTKKKKHPKKKHKRKARKGNAHKRG